MYQHMILMYSDYISGKRIAIHECYESMREAQCFLGVYENIKKEFDHINFGFHHFQTQEKSWKSVVQYDHFFADVESVSIHDFKEIVSNGAVVTPMDVAKLILSRCQCTQLQLQKMVYFFWCKYMKLYDSYVFEEDFEAWKYGPVIDTLYQQFKGYKDKKIKIDDKYTFSLELYSRIVKIPEYDKILAVLDETIKEYGKCSASQLVNKAHIKDGPWDLVYNSGEGQGDIIPKSLISEYVKA